MTTSKTRSPRCARSARAGADADPGAGRQLEILRQPPLEDESLRRVVRIGEAERVAKAVEAFLVERGLGQLRIAPVSRRDVGPAQASLMLAADRRQLQLDARRGHADPPTGER